MPYKRRESKRADTPITPEMIRIFDAMRRATGERRRQLEGDLFDAYNNALMPHPRPHQWPVVEPPGPAPAHRREAQALWLALAAATREARAARRHAQAPARNGRLPAA